MLDATVPTNAELSEILQYVAIFLEVSGLSMAILELQFPRAAARFSAYLHKEYVAAFSYEEKIKSDIVRLTLRVFVVVAMMIVVLRTYSSFVSGSYVLAILQSVFIYAGAAWLAVKLIPERPIGSFGVIIAFVGISFEIWQIAL